MTKKSTIAALIVAGGSSQRLATAVPKPYHVLAGKPILNWALAPFTANDSIGVIMVVIRPQDAALVANCKLPKNIRTCHGGTTRQESVRLGLDALQSANPDFVLIHDAARANLSATDLDAIISAMLANPTNGHALGKKITDTIHRQNDNGTIDVLSRDGLWGVETPQAFSFKAINNAHQSQKSLSASDDLTIAAACGMTVKLIESTSDNFKITHPQDLTKFAQMKTASIPRTGYGYDVHQLVSGNEIVLGGVRIPHDRKLSGHSDADVVLHAVTDALLGTCGGGDIGLHFPPTDDRWKNAPSAIFVKKALDIVAERGGTISNIDITILAEEPKIAPHRTDMQFNIAAILNIGADCVNIKATTSEKMGFVGRGEGIAAHAIATVLYKS